MLSKRLPIRPLVVRSYIFKIYSTESGKSGTEGIPEKNSDKDPVDAKNNEITDKINLILKSMVADNAKRGSESFKSKFPIDNKGFKSRRQTEKPKEEITDLKITEVNFKKAATAVAESLGDGGKQIENDLVAKVMDIQNPVSVNWSELISGMNVDHTSSSSTDAPISSSSRAQEVHSALSRTMDRTQYRQKFTSDTMVRRDKIQHKRHEIRPVDLFGSEPLGIFNEPTTDSGAEVKLWDYLKENELRIAITHPPANYFQKMILWTNQGKLWKFPIDNEQGLQGETDVHFSEHIFLETHLEGWCPRKGPVRHFMELVCVGLSKNPYMPIQEKRDHINWFKEYFDSKKDLLLQVGALPDMPNEKHQQLSK